MVASIDDSGAVLLLLNEDGVEVELALKFFKLFNPTDKTIFLLT